MKQILISIKPKWVAKILNREKTIEIRKTAPKEWVDYINGKTDKKPESMIVNIYCTKGDYIGRISKKYVGKVGAKFRLELVHEIAFCSEAWRYLPFNYFGYNVEERSCLSTGELDSYLNNRRGYAWNISNLVIFDEPKDLSEFLVTKKYKSCYECPHYDYDLRWYCSTCEEQVPLERAPQGWCYVEERE